MSDYFFQQNVLILTTLGIAVLLSFSVQLSQGFTSSQYIGCFAEKAAENGGRVTNVSLFTPGQLNQMPGNIDDCIRGCGNLGYTYAGAQYGGECWCGDSYNDVTSTSCTMTCRLNTSQICGGSYTNSLYSVCEPGSYQYSAPSQCKRQCGKCSGINCKITTGVCLSPCVVGWTGTNCDQDIDECLNKTLNKSEETCVNTEGSFYCIACRTGYNTTADNVTYLGKDAVPGSTSSSATIPLSAFIVCIVVLIVCIIALIAALVVVYNLYKTVKLELLTARTASTSISSASGMKSFDTSSNYEGLTDRNETQIESYEQYKYKGDRICTLYGN